MKNVCLFIMLLLTSLTLLANDKVKSDPLDLLDVYGFYVGKTLSVDGKNQYCEVEIKKANEAGGLVVIIDNRRQNLRLISSFNSKQDQPEIERDFRTRKITVMAFVSHNEGPYSHSEAILYFTDELVKSANLRKGITSTGCSNLLKRRDLVPEKLEDLENIETTEPTPVDFASSI